MNRKILPYLALIIAALTLYFIKSRQTGRISDRVTVRGANEAYTTLRDSNKMLVYSRHALCRMLCRAIDSTEVEQVLMQGTVNFSKAEEDGRGVRYPMEGLTVDGQHVRIVFAPHGNEITVVTAIDLENEEFCDCK